MGRSLQPPPRLVRSLRRVRSLPRCCWRGSGCSGSWRSVRSSPSRAGSTTRARPGRDRADAQRAGGDPGGRVQPRARPLRRRRRGPSRRGRSPPRSGRTPPRSSASPASAGMRRRRASHARAPAISRSSTASRRSSPTTRATTPRSCSAGASGRAASHGSSSASSTARIVDYGRQAGRSSQVGTAGTVAAILFLLLAFSVALYYSVRARRRSHARRHDGRADRPRQPPQALLRHGSRRATRAARRWPSGCSTSTASRRSTTASGTPRATTCSRASAAASRPSSARAAARTGSAATSSW